MPYLSATKINADRRAVTFGRRADDAGVREANQRLHAENARLQQELTWLRAEQAKLIDQLRDRDLTIRDLEQEMAGGLYTIVESEREASWHREVAA